MMPMEPSLARHGRPLCGATLCTVICIACKDINSVVVDERGCIPFLPFVCLKLAESKAVSLLTWCHSMARFDHMAILYNICIVFSLSRGTGWRHAWVPLHGPEGCAVVSRNKRYCCAVDRLLS